MLVAPCRRAEGISALSSLFGLSKDRKVMLRWVLLALFLGVCAGAGQQKKINKNQQISKNQSLARGWGDGINWVETYEEGLSKMVETQKPLMVIHHQADCPYCQALKKVFAAQKTIQRMARDDFIMLNLLVETTDKNMAPDGYYVPRILFVDPSRTVRTDIRGKYGNFAYTYEPSDMTFLIKNMKKAKVLMHTDL